MGYVKYRSDEERTEARRLAKELLTTLIDYLEVHNGTSKSVNKKS